MKKFLMVIMGFCMGIAFVISCGDEMVSIAQEIAGAMDISFDNSATELEADNVQEAIQELEEKINRSSISCAFPSLYLYDGDGKEIGMYAGTIIGGYRYYSTEHSALISINSQTGQLFRDHPTSLYFQEIDCVGKPYLIDDYPQSNIFRGSDGVVYRPKNHLSEKMIVRSQLVEFNTVEIDGQSQRWSSCYELGENGLERYALDIEEVIINKMEYPPPITIVVK